MCQQLRKVPFLNIIANGGFPLKKKNHTKLTACEVVSHRGSDLHFPGNRCLLVICAYCLEKCLSKSFAHLKIGLSLKWCVVSAYMPIWWVLVSYQINNLQKNSFYAQMFLGLKKSNLSFCLFLVAFDVTSKENCWPIQCCRDLCLCFFFWVLVSSLEFVALIHFDSRYIWHEVGHQIHSFTHEVVQASYVEDFTPSEWCSELNGDTPKDTSMS